MALNLEADKIAGLIHAHKLADATREFDNQAPMLGSKAGGNLFYKIAGPLANALYASGDQAGARRILDNTRHILKPKTILDADMKKLEDKIDTPPPKNTAASKN